MLSKVTTAGIAAGSPDEFIIRSAYVMSMDSAIGDIVSGDVHVRGDTVVAVAPNLPSDGLRTIDGSGMILMPGLIDAHTHFWTSQMRGHFACSPDKIYFATRNRLANGYRPQDMYEGTLLGATEAIYSGITTAYDFCHNNRGPDFAEANIRALKDSGIRACFQFGASTLSKPTEPVDLDNLETLAVRWSEIVGGAPLTLGLAWRGPLGIVTIVDDQPKPDWDVARSELDVARRHSLPISIHVSGVTAERQFAALVEQRVLGPDIQIVHMTDARPDQLAEVKQSGASVVLTPLTELRVGYGVTQVGDYLDAGVRLGIGIDSNSLAGTANLFSVMKLFQLIEAGRKKNELAISARTLLSLATIDGARSLGLDGIVGSITPGKKADMILINPVAWNMGLFCADPANLIVEAAAPENVDTVIVNGRILKSGGRLTHFDPEDVIGAARASASGVMQRVA
ncbi:MAG TPA: amidohydrolase family protein [Pseudolabrys sp.]|nr:amidohydrolase family protein [Pseudolabrys sp.]